MKTAPYDRHAVDYDEWFSKNRFAYQSELDAVRRNAARRAPSVWRSGSGPADLPRRWACPWGSSRRSRCGGSPGNGGSR